MNILFWRKKQVLNQSLRALLLISGLFMFAFAMFSPIYAIFVEKIGGDIRTAANSYAVFWLVAGFFTFFAGHLESKMKETEIALVYSQMVIGLAFLLYYFTTNITMLYVVQIVLGIGEALYWPAFHAIYGKHVDGGRDSTSQWGIYDGLAYIIPGLAAILGGYLAKFYGFNLIFIIMALVSFTNGIFILFLPRKML